MPENTTGDNGRSDDATASMFAKVRSEILKFLRSTSINLTVSTVFTLLIYLVCLLFFHPHEVHPEVDSAVLVKLDLTHAPAGNNALLYDLTLTITLSNQNSITKIQFRHLTAGLYYNGTKIGPSETVPSFKVSKEGSRTVSFALRGRASNVSAAVAEAYAMERAQGQFNIMVNVKGMLTYRFFPYKVSYYNRYDCQFQFPPVPGNGTPAVAGAFECGFAT
ncbi:unnamed protein product [Urochloa humidicola]